VYIDRSCRSTASGLYGLLPASQPNTACMHASGAPSSAYELRWTLEIVADVETVVVCLQPIAAGGLAPTAVPTSTCNISQ